MEKQDEGKRHSLWAMIARMLKIGAIGFGGGSALIPVFERELHDFGPGANRKELEKNVVSASITPGALPVEIASGIGEATFGALGMVLAGFALAVPGVLLSLLISCFFSEGSEQIVEVISGVAVVVNLFILYIIIKYIIKVILAFETNRRIFAAFMAFAVFFLTSGKELRLLLHIGGTPIFDISTIAVLMVAFFIILFTEGHVLRLRTVPAVFFSVIYVLGEGGSDLVPDALLAADEVLMAVLAVYGLVHAIQTTRHKQILTPERMWQLTRQELLWLLVLAVSCAPALLIGGFSAVEYILRGIWSSFLSFGGGDAYLTIADGIFVGSGMLDGSVFYRQIIPVANALPGSILCKILSVVGYYIGYGLSESVPAGLLFALAGLGVSVSCSCSIFILMRHVYEGFENLYIFRFLKRWIGTIIAGLLMTVAVTILQDCLSFLIGW